MTDNPYTSPENVAELPARKFNLPRLVTRILVVVGILAFIGVLLLPAPRTGGREAARRMQCFNHLRQIALALQAYHDKYGGLPPAYTVDASGKPLHSWRTLVLPFLEQPAPYEKIDLSKPWNDLANRAAFDAMPSVYHCPSSDVAKGKTTYLAVVVPGGCFQPTESRPMNSITDGASRTITVIEVPDGQAVHWMEPQDAGETVISNLLASKTLPHPNVALAAFADGHVQAITRNIPPAQLQALISAAGDDNDALAGF